MTSPQATDGSGIAVPKPTDSGFTKLESGLRLYYERYGSGPPVVLIAGTGCDHVFWTLQVPAYAAHATMLNLQRQYPEFQYHEAGVNPTNTSNRASDWEAGLVRELRANPKIAELEGERGGGTEAHYFVARPLRVNSPECLRCHSVPDAAPRSMVTKYGPANGFGWKLGDVAALQIVEVPTAASRRKAFDAVTVTVGCIAASFALIQVLLIVFIRKQLLGPLASLSARARALSFGQHDPGVAGRPLPREFGELNESLTRLRNSLSISAALGPAGDPSTDRDVS